MQDTAIALPSAPPASLWAARWRAFRSHALGRVGLALLLLLAALAAGADLLAPHDPNEIFYEHVLAPPSAQFWFGTDELGRDILSRVLFGTRVSLQVVAAAVLASLAVGSAIGLVSGYAGGCSAPTC